MSTERHLPKCRECHQGPCRCWPPDSVWWQAYASIHGFPAPTKDMAIGMAMIMNAQTTEADHG